VMLVSAGLAWRPAGSYGWAMARAKRKLPEAVALGRRGARVRYRDLSPEQRRDIAREAAHARWRTVSPEERSAPGRRAARARWGKAKRKKDANG
jgi:hypothetical protein